MRQEFDRLNFFYEATRRILGDFRIEKAMQSCLLYIRDYIPADYFSLHLFDPGLGVVETVVDATEQESELKSQKTSLTSEARELMHLMAGRNKPGYSIFDRLSHDLMHRVGDEVIAATNRDIEEMVEKGGFRRDLYFRLNVFPIRIPPLRERRLDIPGLAHHFLAKKCRELSLPDRPRVEPGAIDRLIDYDWPGNVRELENIVEREIIIRRGGALTFADFQPGAREPEAGANSAEEGASLAYDAVISRHIARVLKMTKGKVEGSGGAAEILNVNPRTLQYRMKNLGIPFGRKAKGRYA